MNGQEVKREEEVTGDMIDNISSWQNSGNMKKIEKNKAEDLLL